MEQEDQNLTDLDCPNCGYDIRAEIVTTIRPNDKSLEELFEGSLNRVICDQCATEFVCHSPLVFKSEESDYFVYYNPDIAALGWEKAQEQMQTALNASLNELHESERPECRLTLDRNDFIEKIAVHLADMDDKIIEYLKYHIFSHEGLSIGTHKLLYDFSRSDREILEFQVMNIVEGKLMYNTQTPYEMLEQMQNQLESEDCPVDVDEVFSGLYVQVDKLRQQ